jgi:hypothetical protein
VSSTAPVDKSAAEAEALPGGALDSVASVSPLAAAIAEVEEDVLADALLMTASPSVDVEEESFVVSADIALSPPLPSPSLFSVFDANFW